MAKNYKQVIASYEASSDAIKSYLWYLTELIENYPWMYR